MMRQPKYEWISVAEAATRLGVSVSTVRRMVEDGKLVGEREPLGGSRERYRVRFDAPETHQDASPSESDLTPDASPDAPETPHEASLLASGLLERLAAQDALVAMKDAEIARINAEARILAERAARAEARAEMLAADLERSRRPWWKRILDG